MMKKTLSTITLVVCLLAGLSLTACGGNGDLITLAEYEKIEEGMTYDEVVDIIGSAGIKMSEVGEKGSDTYMSVYSWNGKGTAAANAAITFQNDKVTSKVQVGLK